jgi:hypothetical protein
VTTFGFHASHEQLRPSALLRHVVAAEAAGFGAAMCSADLGADEISLHHVGTDPYQTPFIEAFGAKVLPALGPGGRA